MAFKILVTERANDDLEELVRYIARDNSQAAERFGHELLNKLRLLELHPFLGRIIPERSDPSLREVIHGSYRIPYRVRESEHVIEVLRFWHGARGKIELL